MVVSSKLYLLIWWWCYVLTPQWARSSIHFNWYITIHKTIQSPDRWLVSKSREFRSSTKHSSVCGQICFLLNLFAGLRRYSKGPSLIQESVQSSQTLPWLMLSTLFSCILLRFQDSWACHMGAPTSQAWTQRRTVLQQFKRSVVDTFQQSTHTSLKLLRKTSSCFLNLDDQNSKWRYPHTWSKQILGDSQIFSKLVQLSLSRSTMEPHLVAAQPRTALLAHLASTRKRSCHTMWVECCNWYYSSLSKMLNILGWKVCPLINWPLHYAGTLMWFVECFIEEAP